MSYRPSIKERTEQEGKERAIEADEMTGVIDREIGFGNSEEKEALLAQTSRA